MEVPGDWFDDIRRGTLARIDARLREQPALAAARDPAGISAVTWACYARQAEALRALLAAKPSLDVFEAVAAGDEAQAFALLAADPSLARAWSPDGFTALHLAAFFDRPELAARLLALGADACAEARNPTRVAPLHSAATSRSMVIVRALLAAGAAVDVRQAQGFTALMSAAGNGDGALVEALIAQGADASIAADDGRTAADIARARGHEALAERLSRG